MGETTQAPSETKPAAKKAAPKKAATEKGGVTVDEKGRKTRIIGNTVVVDS